MPILQSKIPFLLQWKSAILLSLQKGKLKKIIQVKDCIETLQKKKNNNNNR